MDLYKLKSFALIFIIYLVAMLPTFIIEFKQSASNKQKFIKTLSICTFIEIAIFSLIYFFPREIISFFIVPKNIENYSFYALKILFIASIFTPIHFLLPIYLFKKQKKKKAVILFSLKLIYIPIFAFMNFAFTTKFALFSVPVLDLIYSIILFVTFFKCC